MQQKVSTKKKQSNEMIQLGNAQANGIHKQLNKKRKIYLFNFVASHSAEVLKKKSRSK